MAEVKAFLNDEDGDILIKDGRLRKGNCLAQETGDVLMMNQGELKNAPLIGPNLVRFIRGNTDKMGKQVRVALQRDGKTVNSVAVRNGKIYPDVDY